MSISTVRNRIREARDRMIGRIVDEQPPPMEVSTVTAPLPLPQPTPEPAWATTLHEAQQQLRYQAFNLNAQAQYNAYQQPYQYQTLTNVVHQTVPAAQTITYRGATWQPDPVWTQTPQFIYINHDGTIGTAAPTPPTPEHLRVSEGL